MVILHRAGQAPCLRCQLTSNVRPQHKLLLAVAMNPSSAPMTTQLAVDELIKDLLAEALAVPMKFQRSTLDLNAIGALGRTPLMAVAAEGLVEAVEALVRDGASSTATGEYQMTALHEAAANGHARIVEFLLSRGAAVDAQSTQGVTPLMCAAAWGNSAVISNLLESGADIGRVDQTGATAADIAREKGHTLAAEHLEARAAKR